jgi:hypothetical protein
MYKNTKYKCNMEKKKNLGMNHERAVKRLLDWLTNSVVGIPWSTEAVLSYCKIG